MKIQTSVEKLSIGRINIMELIKFASINRYAAIILFMMNQVLYAQTKGDLITVNDKEPIFNTVSIKTRIAAEIVENKKLVTFRVLENLLHCYFRLQNSMNAYDLADSIIPKNVGKILPSDHITITN